LISITVSFVLARELGVLFLVSFKEINQLFEQLSIINIVNDAVTTAEFAAFPTLLRSIFGIKSLYTIIL
jgi:hypothetical protein